MLRSINDLCNVISGGTPQTSNYNYWNGTIPWISIKDLISGFRHITSTEKTITELGINNSSTNLLQKNDIIISARGTVGELALISKPMAFNQSCYGLRSKNTNILSQLFLFYWLQSHKSYIQTGTHGAVFDTITREDFSRLIIDLPDIDLQNHIVNTIGSVDDLIENYQGQKIKICNLLSYGLSFFSSKTQFINYDPIIIKSGISIFSRNKLYLDTSTVEGINNISGSEAIMFDKRPCRANMQPISNSVWFAKMKGSSKILIVTENDKDIVDNTILSTGFLGIQSSDKLPLSLLTSIVVSNDFHTQRDLYSVGTTMAGVNNETILKTQVPLLNSNEIKSFDEKYSPFIIQLSFLRRKINKLKEIKSKMLETYF